MLALQAVAAGAEPPSAPRILTVTARCGNGWEGDVVVCGVRPDRFRLPLPDERERREATDRGAATGSAALTSPTRCGIFEGERQCSKAEAARFGYGEGRNPIALLGRIGAKLLDSEAETAGSGEAP